VLAVDIPSGVDGLTGVAGGWPAAAIRTVTFAALKPGLLFADGSALAGEVAVADIGLDVSSARAGLVTDGDVAAWWPPRAADAHKWRHAVWVIGGSPGMTGAPSLAASAALRTAAGYVRLSTPGAEAAVAHPLEAVAVALDERGWAAQVLEDASRFGALVIGPGLGRQADTAAATAEVAHRVDRPVVIDGDGLHAIASTPPFDSARSVVLTPHDGEFAALTGSRPGADRIDAARSLAAARAAVVLLKGPTTVVAAPTGEVAVVRSGDARLATAGSGDVLSGMIGSLLAAGMAPFRAAGAGAHLHGRAARLGPATGLVAGDLPDLVPTALATIRAAAGPVDHERAGGVG
jgi:NAD(P)H-hydrate epimerase